MSAETKSGTQILRSSSRCARALASSLLVVACGGDKADSRDDYTVAFDATNSGWLLSTWGTSAANRYAAGGTPDAGVLLHFDGERWGPLAIEPSVPLLNWVFGLGPNDITVVGDSGTVLHFDGATWSRSDSPTAEDLWGIWGASSDHLWAVGGAGRPESKATILAYDGHTWREQDYGELQRANVHAFYKVWGSAENDVYVVGQSGVVLHFDGTSWTELFVGSSVDLITVWGTGPNNVIAVGGRSEAVVSHFDGTRWQTQTYPQIPGINGVWFRSPKLAHLALTTGKLANLDITSLNLSMEQWKTDLDFHALFGTEDGTLTAVGGDFVAYPQGPFHGIALERKLGSDE